MRKTITVIAVLLVVAFVFVPIAAIWALNVLFSAGIAFNLKTWAASFILCGLVYGSTSSGNHK